MGRPKLDENTRRVRLDVYMSGYERKQLVREAAEAGMDLQDYIRARLLGGVLQGEKLPVLQGEKPSSSPYEMPEPVKSGFAPRKTGRETPAAETAPAGHRDDKTGTRIATPIPGKSNDSKTISSDWEVTQSSSKTASKSTQTLGLSSSEVSAKAQAGVEVNDDRRTRARPGHIGSETENSEVEGRSETLASLGARAPARARDPEPRTPEPEDTGPWTAPPVSPLTIILADGTRVNNMWLFANGCRITPADCDRILNTPSLKVLRNSMLKCFAISLRKRYYIRWCEAHNKPVRKWPDTGRTTRGFTRAAEFLAQEYAKRGMTADQFMDAVVEMKSPTLRFPTVDLMGGGLGARVAEWIPPEQRGRDKPWVTREDAEGTQWADMPDGAPAMVIRTKADRERLLKMSRMR